MHIGADHLAGGMMCPSTRGTLGINFDNFEKELLCKRIIMLNKPHFCLLYMLIKLLESLQQATSQHYVTICSICV